MYPTFKKKSKNKTGITCPSVIVDFEIWKKYSFDENDKVGFTLTHSYSRKNEITNDPNNTIQTVVLNPMLIHKMRSWYLSIQIKYKRGVWLDPIWLQTIWDKNLNILHLFTANRVERGGTFINLSEQLLSRYAWLMYPFRVHSHGKEWQ